MADDTDISDLPTPGLQDFVPTPRPAVATAAPGTDLANFVPTSTTTMPASSAPADISDLPVPKPSQSVLGAAQALTSGVIPGAAAVPGQILDTPHKAVETAKIPLALAADALTAPPAGFYKVHTADGKAQFVPKGQLPGSAGSYPATDRPAFLDPSNQDPDTITHWLTGQAKSLLGADYVEEREKTPLNHYINAFSQGATQAVLTGAGAEGGLPGTAISATAGGTASAAQQGVADAGGGPVPQTLAAILAGHTAGHLTSVAETPGPVRTTASARNTPEPPSGAFTADSLLTEGATKRGEIAAPNTAATAERGSARIAPDTIAGTTSPTLVTPGGGEEEIPVPRSSRVTPERPVPSRAGPEDSAGIVAGVRARMRSGALKPEEGADTGGLAETMDEDREFNPLDLSQPKSGLTSGTEPFSILSAERSERTPEENAVRTTNLENQLKATGLPYEAVYMGGAPENGFSVSTANPAARGIVEALAKQHDQESVLHVDGDQNGRFKYVTGDKTGVEEPMGKFQMVPKAEAEAAVGYTRTPAGNHYILKSPEEASTESPQQQAAGNQPAVPAPAAAPPTPAQARALSFRRPLEEGQQSGPVGQSEQMARRQILAGQGIAEARTSAITGDSGAAGSDYQTSKLDNAYGKRMAGVIANERSAIRSGANDLVAKSGGTDGLENADLYNRGSTIGRAPDMFNDYLDKAIQQNYTEATARLGGKPIPAMTETQNYLKANKSNFLGTIEGKQLLEGVNARMKELGFVGDNDTFNPPSVEQAERLRQYLGDQWTPRTGRLVGALKDSVDNDVAKAAGEDVYAKARSLNTMRDQLLRSPKLVSSLLSPADGLNRTVPVENIPKTVTGAPVDQFGHLVNVLKEMGSTDPHLAASSAEALNEIRAQFMNEYRAAGNSTEGMWNAKAGGKYLENNNLKMASVFSPTEMQGIKNHNDAAAILKMDRSYPGASAQHHNFLVGGALKGVEHLGGIAGATLGEIPGAVVGLGAQKLAGKLDDKLMMRRVEQRIENLLLPTAAAGGASSQNAVTDEFKPMRKKFSDDISGVTPPSLVQPVGQGGGQQQQGGE